MSDSPDRKIALVAGATRGAGRGIAVELSAIGATVYVTGRSTRGHRSEMDRPETIDETAEMVTAAGAGAFRCRWTIWRPRRYATWWRASTGSKVVSTCSSTTSGVVSCCSAGRDGLAIQPHFAISETPAYVGRAVAALATDASVSRWNGQSLSSGQLAREYDFTDVDGSRPDAWRYLAEVQDPGKPADVTGYR